MKIRHFLMRCCVLVFGWFVYIQGDVKLLDLGLSRVVSKSEMDNARYNMTGETGSARYMAPEVRACCSACCVWRVWVVCGGGCVRVCARDLFVGVRTTMFVVVRNDYGYIPSCVRVQSVPRHFYGLFGVLLVPAPCRATIYFSPCVPKTGRG